VRSIAPDQKIGFGGHSLPLYAVDMSTTDTIYHLYCVNFAPDAGHSYRIEEGYATDGIAPLKLWPLDRGLLVLPTGVSNKGKRLYRIVVINDAIEIHPDRPNFPCDIHAKTPRSVAP
jgi:hypothetical protein